MATVTSDCGTVNRIKMLLNARFRTWEHCRLKPILAVSLITCTFIYILNGSSTKWYVKLEAISGSSRSTESLQRTGRSVNLPKIYAITPTYRRAMQMPELTRLSQTLMHVPNLHWIVVEDSNTCTPEVVELLNRTGLSYTHLLGPRPPNRMKRQHGRGVSNRRKALRWIRKNATGGVFYFADDDNSYDIRVFEEMRYTKKVSVWPVGLIGKFATVSSPVVKDGKVVGFHDTFQKSRKFAVDMAGFAVSVELFLKRPNSDMDYIIGFQEDRFLRSLGIQIRDLEPKADNCTKVLVWHTKSIFKHYPPPPDLVKINMTHPSDNIQALYKDLLQNGAS